MVREISIISRCVGGLVLLAALAGCGTREGGPAPVDMKGQAAVRESAAKPVIASVPDNYQVQRGDTVYALARKFEVPVKALIDLNQLQPPYALVAGQKLQLPRQKVHTVESGETLYSVSRKYGVDVSALVRANNLQEPYAIRVGQKLTLPAPVVASVQPTPAFTPSSPPLSQVAVAPPPTAPVAETVPARPVLPPPTAAEPPPPAREVAPTPAPPPTPVARPVPPPVAPAPTAAPTAAPPPAPKPQSNTAAIPAPTPAEDPPKPAAVAESAPAAPPEPPTKPTPAAAPPPAAAREESGRQPPPPPPRAGKTFAWPVRGRVIATFGSQGGGLHNDGINIQAPKGTPVRAAENGVVAYAGGEIKGFGNLLLIRHADGFMTAYAHNEALLVKRGDVVRRGQVISRVGATGNVEFPQLHFEVRKGSQAVDPEQVLGSPSVS